MRPRWALAACSLLLSTLACATPAVDDEGDEFVNDFDLRVATAAPGSLDPARVSTEPGRWLIKQLCDPLVGLNPGTGELQPGIAEAWTVSDDARRVTFTLREGVTFHNGDELVANDYLFSLSRIVQPQTESPAYHLLDKVVGFAEVRSEQVPFLAGVTAPDPRTLVVELSEPFAPFPAVMANPSVGAAVPAAALEDPDRDFDVRPVCTGPYKIDGSSGDGDQIRLVRYEDYDGAGAKLRENGRGYAATIRWRIAADAERAYEMLEAGNVDIAPVPASRLAAAREGPANVSSGDSGHLTYIGLPVDQPGFDSPPFRRALALSMDRSAIVKGMLGRTRGLAEGFLPQSAGPAAPLTVCGDSFPPQPQEAAALAAFQEADRPPSQFNLHLNSSGGHENWLQAVATQWETALGVKAELQSRDWDGYLDYLKDPGADGPFRLSWETTYPSPESILEPLFASDSLDNFTGYSNPGFDDLLSEAASTIDPVERSTVYSHAAKLLCDDVPAIPVWFGTDHVAFGPQVVASGEQRIDIFGDPILREVRYLQ